LILPSCLTNAAFTICFIAHLVEVCLKPENVLLRLCQPRFSSFNCIQLRLQDARLATSASQHSLQLPSKKR